MSSEAEIERIQSLCTLALQGRGSDESLEALEALGKLCAQRRPYQHPEKGADNTVSFLPSLIPENITQECIRIVESLARNGCLSTNPDSVDGLPSLHLNLISDGRSVAKVDSVEENDFQRALEQLRSLLLPFLEETLLPRAREMTGSDNLRIGDVFLRRYGQNVVEENSRQGISAHYDVFSRITSVVAMDNVASEGTNGLFTTLLDAAGRTSNHASLRRFFPLCPGDAVLHTWEVLHGVDVQPGINRTSLIVWFVEGDNTGSDSDCGGFPSPWLLSSKSSFPDVQQFVLGSAYESAGIEKSLDDIFNLYFKSARKGNTFALTRLGSLFEEMPISRHHLACVDEILKGQNDNIFPEAVFNTMSNEEMVPLRLWYEASIRGNPLAMRSLGDEIMHCASVNGDRACRVFAAILFGMAAQQNDHYGKEALERLVAFEVAVEKISDQETFSASPVVKVATSASMYI